MNKVNWEQLSEQQLYDETLYDFILNSPNNSTRIKLEQTLLDVASKYKIKTTIRKIYEDYKKQKDLENQINKKQEELEKRNNNIIDFGEKAPIRTMLAPGYYIDDDKFIRTEKNTLVTSTLIQPISILKNLESSEELVKCAFLNRRKMGKFCYR